MPEAEEKPSTTDELLKEAKANFKLAEDAWSDNRKAWLEDAKFRSGDHWPEELKKLRDTAGRPALVVDKLNQYIRQVVNDGRQNRPAVKVRPIDDTGDDEIAEALQGVIRHVCDRSNADEAFDSALEHAVVGGFGFFRVLTDYAHENTFNQEIEVARIRNPLSVLLDPNAQKADGSDAKFGFVIDEMEKEEFKEKYPDAEYTDWVANASKYSDGWESDKNVRICEYWYKEEVPTKVHLLADGTTADDEDYQLALTNGVEAPPIVETRTIPRCTVKWCRMSGAEILEQNDWLGVYIPIIPVYGNEYDIDGKVTYSGLIRAAKDPQRLYNYSRSAYAERVALTPKAPFIAAAGQVDEHPEWETANSGNYSVLKYDPVDVNGTALPAPQRQQASDIPEGFARDMQLSEHDIQASMGMYNASLGEKSNEKSGRAIMARQREGDTATFHYQDNLNRAIRHLGRILVDLIPKVYDSKRVIRLLGEDGDSTQAEVNPDQEQAVERQGSRSIYNLNVGTYDVSVAAGPSYTTRRVEQAEAMMQLIQASPEVMQIAGDLFIKSQDWPGADDLAERFKLMLPPPIQQALQAEESKSLPPEAQAIVSQAQMAVQQRDQQIQEMGQAMQEAQQAVSQLQLQVKSNADKVQVDMLKLQIEQFKAQTDRMQAEAQMSATPEDTSQFDAIKLQYEDKWKQLEADTRVVVAEIAAKTSLKTASMSQPQTDGVSATDETGEPVPNPALSALIDAVNSNMAALLQGQQAIAEGQAMVAQHLSRPKTVVRGSDGRVVGIQ